MTRHDVLPKELMELQLGQIDLLMAMYESDSAVAMDDTYLSLIESLKNWCETDETSLPEFSESSVSLLLTLALSNEDDTESIGKVSLQLEISVPLISQEKSRQNIALTEPPKAKVRIRQPEWMSRAEVAHLTDEIPDEDMLTAIDHVKEAASQYLKKSQQIQSKDDHRRADGPIDRTWFYFPSISTRSKRDDIVNYAPNYGLTGFLLAGKPGVLCLEGNSRAVDDYMKFIKTESWGDIPPQHKKVSERYRESGSYVERAFQNMQEITHLVGERRGERANRNDMKALEAWLTEHGVGEAFGKVLI